MKRKYLFFLAVTILLSIGLFSSFVQGTSCGDNISVSTTLTTNLSNCTGYALLMNTSNVVLDCDGYTLSANVTEGWDGAIYIYNVNNVTIKDCKINGLGGTGVNISGGNNHTIINNTFFGLTQAVTTSVLGNVGFLNISNNYVNGSGWYNLELVIANSTISDNVLTESYAGGIWINGTNNTISRNLINVSDGDGIYLKGIFDGVIANNTISSSLNDSLGNGMRIEANGTLNITNNTFYNNSGYGIYFGYDLNFNTMLVWHNNFYSNAQYYGGVTYGAQVFSNTQTVFNLSYNSQGNYWGRTSCPLFVEMSDAYPYLYDDYPYNASFAWLTMGSPPSCDQYAPVVTLLSPDDGNLTYIATMTFSCSATDNETALNNISLRGNFTGTLALNATNSTPSNNTQTNFTIGLSDGYYWWNCYACDNASNCDQQIDWYDITVAATGPIYSSNSTNSTYAGQAIKHNLYLQDNNSISGYVFSFDNGNGSFVNDSWIGMTGTGNWSNVTKSVNSTIGSTIQWKVYANDSYNQWSVSSAYSYVLVDVNAPTLTLNLPVLSANLSSTTVTFNCSATDATGLANISLWGNWSSWSEKNQSNVSGLANSSQWTNVLTANAMYKWACYTCDNISNCGFSSNYTFIIDNVKPTVHLRSPSDDTNTTTRSQTFRFNVTDDFPIKNCSLYVDGDLNQTLTNVDNDGSQQSFSSISLDYGTYDWYVQCYDYSGNYNNSFETWRIVIYDNSGSGSNTGGGTSSDDNCPPNQKRCSAGNVEQCLNDEWKIITNCSYGCNSTTFTCKLLNESTYAGNNLSKIQNKTFTYTEINETIEFIIGNNTHTVFVKNITNTTVTVIINSTPITTTLTVNETKTFDLNKNGKMDFSLTLLKITDDTADLLLKAIDEPSSGGGLLGSKPLLNFNFSAFGNTLIRWKWYIIGALILIVVALVVVMIVMKKKKDGKYTYVKINNKSVQIKKREGGGIRVEKH